MYRIFNIDLESDIPLPELPVIKENSTVSSLNIKSTSNIPVDEAEWFHHIYDNNKKISISCGRIKNNYLLRFPNLVDFYISLSEQSIFYTRCHGIPDTTLRHLLLDQVIPRILGQQGKIILHASAIETKDGNCLVFAGNTGAGKSTLASSYLSTGHKLITDDCLLLDINDNEVITIPNYYGIRLFDDSITALFGNLVNNSELAHYTTKKRLLLDEHPNLINSIFPVKAVFVLSPFENTQNYSKISIDKVKGANEIMSLIKQLFILDATDLRVVSDQFKNIGNLLAKSVKIFHLRFPHDHNQLPQVQNSINSVL